jgi:NAD(P)H-quinone oxidoreductase subunit 5
LFRFNDYFVLIIAFYRIIRPWHHARIVFPPEAPMHVYPPLILICALAPMLLMGAAALAARTRLPPATTWAVFHGLSLLALLAAGAALAAALGAGAAVAGASLPGLTHSLPGAWLALLVQFLGTVIGAFSSRYLQGEPGQARYASALAGVLAAVQLLLLADHWLVLIAAWSAAGRALQALLCFYADRPFAQLAAHKKRLADRAADVLLVLAAALAWWQVGSGSLSDLRAHLSASEASVPLQAGAVCLVLAVMLRTALLPVHGWLIQVMEAPTPVSALLHAGVINLGAFVLIRLAPLLDSAPLARGLLVVMGLGTAALAGLVMLTRVSIKVRLAWSTVAQMGFMLMECGLGLYTLALLHLIGHSLYKAHTFLASSSVVRHGRQQALRGPMTPAASSLLAAPLAAAGIVAGVGALVSAQLPALSGAAPWPWWWSAVLALAWAPLLWLPAAPHGTWRTRFGQATSGALLVAGLTLLACLSHIVPLGVTEASIAADSAGLLALVGMAALYVCLAVLQWRPQALEAWRRWSYAGFYVDEFYTRLALRLSPRGWAPRPAPPAPMQGTRTSSITAAR